MKKRAAGTAREADLPEALRDASEAPFTETTVEATPSDENGATILNDVMRFVRRFVVLSDEQLAAVALWVLHTHAIDAADATPYLNITSAEKRSGKTRLLEVLELLVARPWRTGRTSPAALVRKIHGEKSTLLLDESDAAFKGDREYGEALRGILNDGHRRGGCATLCVGKGADIKVREFSVFGPKAIAGIGNALPDTVRDRSIQIELKRQVFDERAERFHRRKVEQESTAVRGCIEAWASNCVEALKTSDPAVIEEISDRAFDGWEPLLAIAEAAGGGWPTKAREAAMKLSSGADVEDDSAGVLALSDARRVFKESKVDRFHTDGFLEKLYGLAESPWATWHYGKPLSPRGLAKLLRRYGIRSKQVWVDGTNKHGYLRKDFADAWRRYLEKTRSNARNARSSKNKGKTRDLETLGGEASSVSESAENSDEIDFLAPLADKSPLSNEEPRTPCNYLIGKPGESCKRCGASWVEHYG